MLRIVEAGPDDAAAIAGLKAAVAEHLTERYGPGHWSRAASERGVLSGMRHARMLLARSGAELVGVLRLARRKPWAIDPAQFTPVPRPLYLTDMAVAPQSQGRGYGRHLLEEAEAVARSDEADALRLDAYDAPAGGGPFYARCGYAEVGRVSYRGTPLIYYERVLAPAVRGPRVGAARTEAPAG